MQDITQNPPRRPEWGSDVIVDLLKAYGIEYVAFNPSSTFRGIHDSLVNYGGNKAPEILLCCHEEISIDIAHGYAKATGKPMVAICYGTGGLLHASMAVYGAWCDRAPVIVLGGNGPADAVRRRPSTDWRHTAVVPGNVVREFTKWDDHPASLASLAESFMRAYKVAMTPPTGPVYISCNSELQEEKLSQPFTMPDVERYRPAYHPEADREALRLAAQWLVEADAPVMMADHVYRSRPVAKSLTELAELLAIPIVDPGRYSINFIPSHPLNATGAARDVLERADVVLAIDTSELSASLEAKDSVSVTPNRYLKDVISAKTRVVQISLAQLLIKSWSCDYGRIQPVDLDILADTELALPQLISMCRELIGNDPGKLEKYRQRFERLRGLHDQAAARWREQAAVKREERPVSLSRLCEDVWEVIKGEDWVLVNDDVRSWNQRLWEWTGPDQWLGHSGGGGLGFGPGGSVGAALAFKNTNKLCINLEADGNALYTASALWTAAHHRIPFLTVMYNNRSYHNSEQHGRVMARTRGRPVENCFIGTKIDDPPVDFAGLARAYGVYGEGPIEKPEDLKAAVARAMKVVKEKRIPALVDVVTQPR